MASIADGELRAYARRHILRTVDPDHKVLTVPVLAPEAYKRWRGEKIEEFA